MPKYYKKPKGLDAHQHVEGEDWTQAEAWVQDLITYGRLVTGPPVVAYSVPIAPQSVNPTDWITLTDEGFLDVMTDAAFTAAYEKDKRIAGG